MWKAEMSANNILILRWNYILYIYGENPVICASLRNCIMFQYRATEGDVFHFERQPHAALRPCIWLALCSDMLTHSHILIIQGFPSVTDGISCINDYETYQMKLEICTWLNNGCSMSIKKFCGRFETYPSIQCYDWVVSTWNRAHSILNI
jgi:hypothetical protein